ncbi:MAG TPA: FAD-dependent oxidoreductase [Pseudogracilibacillus sp.]|nr:FAD-dependent oxidoreductase [Pseudogracilibacillus sp.]
MNYVIIGGDAAGMSAAMQMMKYDPEAEITILEKGEIYSYAQCGMPYVIGGVVDSVDDLIARDVDVFREKYGMDARTLHEVERVDTKERTVSGRIVGTGETFQVPYDKLLIASGASPFVPIWKGMDVAGIHTLKTIPDTTEIAEDVKKDVQDITIVGGGYIGLEMAENFRKLGKKVRMLIRSGQVAKIFDESMAAYIMEEAERHGIDVLLHEEIKEVIGKESVTAIRTNKTIHETDMVLVATGIQPNTAFLQGSGVDVARNGAVQVNEWMETNVRNVYAAGDCAQQYHLVKEAYDYVPLGTHANKQGRIAGMNMAGQYRVYRGMTGTSIMQFVDLTLGKTGLSDREAANQELPYASVEIAGKHMARYYPGSEKISVKLTFRTDNGLLLGGQLVGKAGIDKRTDVLATALFNKMTVEQLEDLDLSYAPPYNGVWDPIQRAARKAVGKVMN